MVQPANSSMPFNLAGKVLHVLVELLFGYLRVYLCRLYALVSQHGTHRFDGYAVGEEHRRGCRVAALMPRDMLGDAATLGDGTDSGKARVVMRNGEYPAVLAQPTVFADDALGDVKQADIGHHARLLAVDVYPLVFVEVVQYLPYGWPCSTNDEPVKAKEKEQG